jgi:hypothetical protein
MYTPETSGHSETSVNAHDIAPCYKEEDNKIFNEDFYAIKIFVASL